MNEIYTTNANVYTYCHIIYFKKNVKLVEGSFSGMSKLRYFNLPKEMSE